MSAYVDWYGGERRQSWATPPEFFRELDAEFVFTLDGASELGNGLLPHSSTAEVPIPWEGERVFCNPPWSNIPPFVELAASAAFAVLLVPARTNASLVPSGARAGRDGALLQAEDQVRGGQAHQSGRLRAAHLRQQRRKRSGCMTDAERMERFISNTAELRNELVKDPSEIGALVYALSVVYIAESAERATGHEVVRSAIADAAAAIYVAAERDKLDDALNEMLGGE